MRSEVFTREFSIPVPDNAPHRVRITLGDSVWYFHRGDLSARPNVATVTELCDQGQVCLSVWDPTTGGWVPRTGVCILGDERLTNINVLHRGVWTPRALWPQIVES